MSYNVINDQQDLMYTSTMKNLLFLTITGNPMALRGAEEYSDLENILSANLSAVVINRSEFSGKATFRRNLSN